MMASISLSKILVKKATRKKRPPRPIMEPIIKGNSNMFSEPAAIVKTLYGIGEIIGLYIFGIYQVRLNNIKGKFTNAVTKQPT